MNLNYNDLMDALEGAKHGSALQRKIILELAKLIEHGSFHTRKDALVALRGGKVVYNDDSESSPFVMIEDVIYSCSYNVEEVDSLRNYYTNPDVWGIVELGDVTDKHFGTRIRQQLSDILYAKGVAWPFPFLQRPAPPATPVVEAPPPPEAVPIIEEMNRPEPKPEAPPEPLPCAPIELAATPSRGDLLEMV